MSTLPNVIVNALHDAADLRVVYTESITATSYHLAQRQDGAVLFLHPSAAPLVETAKRTLAEDSSAPQAIRPVVPAVATA